MVRIAVTDRGVGIAADQLDDDDEAEQDARPDHQRLHPAIAGAGLLVGGALGNVVRQLHVHVVARDEGDAAWPGPVWGSGPARRYPEAEQQALLARLRGELATLLPD